MSKIVLRRAQLTAGRVLDVRVEGARITQIGEDLPIRRGETTVDCAGGALLPGLHDHHIHLLALAAARDSVDCSSGLEDLRSADGSDWVRGVGYDESVGGRLDRWVLDGIERDRPVRVQHRSGALWVLNSAALARVEKALDGSVDVERDVHGSLTGRLWRYDARLRAALPLALPNVEAVVRDLHAYGITGVTDATPDLGDDAIEELERGAHTLGTLVLLGAPDGHRAAGPRKLHLRDHDLPTFDRLVEVVVRSHAARRPVAVHCVTRESLLLTLAVLQEVGPMRGDRIEHASVVPPEVVGQMAALGLAVVTQPSLVRLRGDSYLSRVDPRDHECLYPFASLLARDIPVAGSSDAPHGDPDPWQGMGDAVDRLTTAGRILGPSERVTPYQALSGYLSAWDSPGGARRSIATGAPADLVLLDRPLLRALSAPSSQHVRAVLSRGVWVHGPL